MGFYHAEQKKERKEKTFSIRALQNMPTEAMAELGCKVCPQLAKTHPDGAQLESVGHDRPDVYILLSAPTEEDGFFDLEGNKPRGKANAAIYRKLPVSLRARVGGIVQCESETVDVDPVAVSCCRGRVERDIEQAQPRVVIGFGDGPLRWATGLSSALTFGGTPIITKIGSHVCWYFPVMYPNFAFKERGDSAYENWFTQQINTALDMLDSGEFEYPEDCYAEPESYDSSIEYIVGNKPGDLERLQAALNRFALEPKVGVDIETNGLRVTRVKNPKILMCSISTHDDTVVFNLDHREGWGSEHQKRQAWSMLGEFLLHSGRKIAHNLSMEAEWFSYFYGPDVLRLTEWGDTMAAAYVLDGRPGTKSLGVQTRIHFGFNLKEQSNLDVTRLEEYPLLGKGGSMRYNGMDSKWTLALDRVYTEKLAQCPKLREQYETKCRLAHTLVMTEAMGMSADVDVAKAFEVDFKKRAQDCIAKILRTAEVAKFERQIGRPYQPGNDDDVLILMKDVLKRDECKREDYKTKKIGYSVDSDVLGSLPAKEVPSAALTLELRGVEKQLSTYIDPVTSGRILSLDGLVHGKYSSMTAITNRLACEDPNLQNWPKRKFREIRRIITARKSRWWKLGKLRKMVAVDFGQIEFRVGGMCSGDDTLMRACWTGYDVHMDWAKRVIVLYPQIKDWILEEFAEEFKTGDWDEPNKSGKSTGMALLRQEMKNKWVFPCIFGAAVKSRAENLHLPEHKAKELDGDFWDEFKGLKRWQEDLLRFYSKHGYVETLGGFRRRGAMSPNEVINMPIQGTACEIVVESMIACSELAYTTDNWDVHPILNVHDDLTYDMEEDTMLENISIVAREMCKPRHSFVNVPLIVEVSVGDNWADLKGVAEYSSTDVWNIRNPYDDKKSNRNTH